jgi:hypothetical protein
MFTRLYCSDSVMDCPLQLTSWMFFLSVPCRNAIPTQCRDMVRGLAPAAVQWLRMNADPETMCGSISVCGGAPHVTNPFKVTRPFKVAAAWGSSG